MGGSSSDSVGCQCTSQLQDLTDQLTATHSDIHVNKTALNKLNSDLISTVQQAISSDQSIQKTIQDQVQAAIGIRNNYVLQTDLDKLIKLEGNDVVLGTGDGLKSVKIGGGSTPLPLVAGSVTADNLTSNDFLTATGKVTAGSMSSNGSISAAGEVSCSMMSANTLYGSSLNVDTINPYKSKTITVANNLTVADNLTVTDSLTVSQGNIGLTAGTLNITKGDIVAPGGSISCKGDITTAQGDLVSMSGTVSYATAIDCKDTVTHNLRHYHNMECNSL